MRPLALSIFFAGACVTAPTTVEKGDLEALKPQIETFHQRSRWHDFRGAGDLVVPEKRDAFLKARAAMNDEKDLNITDYQLEDAKLATDGASATVVSRVNWYRLPSVSEKSVLVTSRFVWRNGAWLLDSQDGGPFASELTLTVK